MRSATLKSKFKSTLLPCAVKQGTSGRFVRKSQPMPENFKGLAKGHCPINGIFVSSLLPCVVKQGTPRRFVQINHPINGIFTPSQIQGKVSRTTRFPHPKVQRTTNFLTSESRGRPDFLTPKSRGRNISSSQSPEDD